MSKNLRPWWLLGALLIHLSLFNEFDASKIRNRRENSVSAENPSSPLEVKSYKPPLLAAPPSSQAVPYQPPLLLASSNDYKPLISSSQTQSIRYQAPANAQGSPSYTYSHSQGYGAPLLASAQTNSGSPNALPLQPGNRQGFSYSSDTGSANQFQSQPLQQAGSKPESGTVSKEGNPQNDEYVVYYYYYYDNDNTTGAGANKSNNSLNFDDIPSLESYDTDKTAKEPEKSASARTLAANVNSLGAQDAKRLGNQDDQSGSQPRSLSGLANQQPPFIRSDIRTNFNSDEPSDAHPLKPVSNVYRYGTNEVPRFPVLPNFVVSNPPSVTRSVSSGSTQGSLNNPLDNPTTQPSSGNAGSQLPGSSDHESDDINVVLDQPVESKLDDEKEKSALEDLTTTTTTTEPTTTTEDPTTTTTEKSRRRQGAGNRRRFNPSPTSFTSSRRQGGSRSTSSTTTSTTSSPGSSSTRSSFRGSNRVRSRPTVANNRPRPSFSRNSPSTGDGEESTKSSNSSSISTTTARPKFGGGSATGGRRFSSTRTRSQPGATTRNSSSTSSPVGRSAITSAPRTRPSVRPRPNNLVSRGRGPRPGFLRPRPGSEPEEPETTTTTSQKADDESSSAPSSSSSNDPSTAEEEADTDEDSDEDTETSETETEEPTTTEKSRFSALFRPRNRNTLNRPRPVVGERSRRS